MVVAESHLVQRVFNKCQCWQKLTEKGCYVLVQRNCLKSTSLLIVGDVMTSIAKFPTWQLDGK